MQNILISLIVPVYNVERYVAECIESLSRQSWPEIEIICIDDGSTDGSSELLKMFACLDSRIKIYHTDNNGVSSARNLGIQMATGQVIMFVDADDVLEPFACELVARSYSSNKWDIMKFSATPFPEGAAEPWITDVLTVPNRFEIDAPDADDLVFDRHSRPFIWNGAYRASFLKLSDVLFPEAIKIGEDQVFSFATLARTNRVVFSSKPMYRYRVARSDSAMSHSSCDISKKIAAHIEMLGLIIDDWTLLNRMDGDDGRKMLEFCTDFIIPDLYKISDIELRIRLVDKMSQMLQRRLSKEKCSSMLNNSPLQKWFEALYNNDVSPKFTSIIWKYRYRCDLLGLRAFLMLEIRNRMSHLFRWFRFSAKNTRSTVIFSGEVAEREAHCATLRLVKGYLALK